MADKGNILLYQTKDGESKIEVRLANDTVWLTLDQMAELFQRNKSTVSRHIKNILESGELKTDSTVAFFATVQKEGERRVEREIAYYNLDMIISIGYRVNSYRGIQFRIWATQVLKEYLVKGFALNDDLLKRAGGGNYFDELLARIRDIRSSEKIFYRKILEIYALSIDYAPSVTLDFAELQAQSHKPMYMKDWIQKLDDFLRLSGKELLTHVGTISAELAKEKANLEYDKFKERTTFQLSPVEIHFIENFEKEQKKLKNKS